MVDPLVFNALNVIIYTEQARRITER